jgi:pantoate--beta-alanine ligase
VQLITAAAELTERLTSARAAGAVVGLVPTMGALHRGHRSLVQRATRSCDVVVVTIFVNPLQFGDLNDLEQYPRTLEADMAACEAAGVDVVFAPTIEEMYPCWPGTPATTVTVGDLGTRWEGASRPGHFDGVATVVAKLFVMVGPCRAYFGEKDFQQLTIIRQLVQDLAFPVTIVGCPTVREGDGLAMSSRNGRLGPRERSAATVLSAALAAGRQVIERGERDPWVVSDVMAAIVKGEPLATLDYAAVVDPHDLVRPTVIEPHRPVRLVIAGRIGSVRLIDNCEAWARSSSARGSEPARSLAGRAR